jgi:hypothetical protein
MGRLHAALAANTLRCHWQWLMGIGRAGALEDKRGAKREQSPVLAAFV